MPINGEPGAASILIKLEDGEIKVWHGTDSNWILGEKKHTSIGDWDRLIEALKSVGIKWGVKHAT